MASSRVTAQPPIRAFISHSWGVSRLNHLFATELKDRLEMGSMSAGLPIRAAIFEEKIEHEKQLLEDIAGAIAARVDVLLALITPDFYASAFSMRELEFAREMGVGYNLPVIPVVCTKFAGKEVFARGVAQAGVRLAEEYYDFLVAHRALSAKNPEIERYPESRSVAWKQRKDRTTLEAMRPALLKSERHRRKMAERAGAHPEYPWNGLIAAIYQETAIALNGCRIERVDAPTIQLPHDTRQTLDRVLRATSTATARSDSDATDSNFAPIGLFELARDVWNTYPENYMDAHDMVGHWLAECSNWQWGQVPETRPKEIVLVATHGSQGAWGSCTKGVLWATFYSSYHRRIPVLSRFPATWGVITALIVREEAEAPFNAILASPAATRKRTSSLSKARELSMPAEMLLSLRPSISHLLTDITKIRSLTGVTDAEEEARRQRCDQAPAEFFVELPSRQYATDSNDLQERERCWSAWRAALQSRKFRKSWELWVCDPSVLHYRYPDYSYAEAQSDSVLVNEFKSEPWTTPSESIKTTPIYNLILMREKGMKTPHLVPRGRALNMLRLLYLTFHLESYMNPYVIARWSDHCQQVHKLVTTQLERRFQRQNLKGIPLIPFEEFVLQPGRIKKVSA